MKRIPKQEYTPEFRELAVKRVKAGQTAGAVAPNLLDRDFAPEKPNQVWTADLTYIWTDEGWLYLAVVLDLFDREVVGWSIKPRMTADIVIDALTMAWFRKKPAPGLMHHSDRGSQYASHASQARLKEYGTSAA